MWNPYNPWSLTGLILSQQWLRCHVQQDTSTSGTFLVAFAHWWHNFIMFDQILLHFRMWRQSTTTALSSCPGGLENALLTRDSSKDFNPNLLLYNEQSDPDSQVLDLEYLPYYRTSHICVCPAPYICTERQKSSNESKADTKQDKQVSYSATPQDIFHAAGHLKSFLANHSYRLHIWLNWVKYLRIRFRWTHIECF